MENCNNSAAGSQAQRSQAQRRFNNMMPKKELAPVRDGEKEQHLS